MTGIDKATVRLAAIERDLDELQRRIESSRYCVKQAPRSIQEDLAQARPRVREAVSRLFGLRWDQAEPALAAAHGLEKRIEDLERQLTNWSPLVGVFPPVASPSAGGAITGFVTDEATGNPLANVTVRAQGAAGSAESKSDATGRWTVTGLPTGTYYVFTNAVPTDYVREVYNNIPCWSYCDSYSGTPIAVTDGASTSGINFALAKFGGISGTVTDVTTGAAAAGVRILLYAGASSSLSSYLSETYTGSDGSYQFQLVAPGSYFLRTSSPAYFDELYDNIACEGGCDVTAGVAVTVSSGAATQNVNFVLQRGGTVAGRVISAATGAPITSGSVQLYTANNYIGYSNLSPTGTYEITGLPSGTYYAVTSMSSQYADELYDGILCEPSCDETAGTPITVTAGHDTTDINFSLATLGAFQGMVVDSVSGFPVPNTPIEVYSSDGSLYKYHYSDFTGRYVIGGLTAGTYFAKATSTTHLDELYNDFPCQPSCTPTTGTPIVVAFGSTTNSIDFVLELGGGIRGRVVAASGIPLDNARVEVFNASGAFAGSASTSGQGDFVLDDLLAGTYFAKARVSGTHLGQLYDGLPCEPLCTVTSGTPITVTKGVATTGVNFALAAFGTISGTMKDDVTGSPIPFRYVNIHDSTGAYFGYASTDSSGYFQVKGLPAGTYFATGSAPGYVSQLYNGYQCLPSCTVTTGTPIPVMLNSDVPGINFSLTPLGGIKGRITDAASGLPLPYFEVALHDAAGGSVVHRFSDDTGYYQLSGLSPGNYFVSTYGSTDYVDELYQNLDCGAPCDVKRGTPVTVTLATVTSAIDFKLHKPYFADAGLSHWARRFIEGIYVAGVTAGCGTDPLRFCPDDNVTRWQMAVFLATSMAGSAAAVPFSGTVPSAGPYSCVPGGVSLFPLDVPPADAGCRFIHYIYGKGLTSGCGPGSFCPQDTTSRWQAAVFLAGAVAGSDAAVPFAGTVAGVGTYNCVQGGATLFPNDVPPTDGACRHIHYIYSKGLTAGCAPGSFCPSVTLSRAQMSVFVSTGFNFTRYGP